MRERRRLVGPPTVVAGSRDDAVSWYSANLRWLESLTNGHPQRLSAAWRERLTELGADPTEAEPAPNPVVDPVGLFGGGRSDREIERRLDAQHRVTRYVESHRRRGHEAARLDPLGRDQPVIAELTRDHHGLGGADRSERFFTDVGDGGVATLEEIERRLDRAYLGSLSAQLGHLRDTAMRRFVQERLENPKALGAPDDDDRRTILRRLVRARVFDELIQKRYLGAKTFSAEGAHTLLPMMAAAIELSATAGAREVVVGMGHRGRLNVLFDILDKPAWLIFREFEDDNPAHFEGRGDVTYHLGASTDVDTKDGPVHVSLCFNPSHLETVNAVAMGRMRAKQDRIGDDERRRGMVLLIHGDASFAGEGAVQESLNLGGLAAYETGGTIHIVVDNQLGFTTGPAEGRSTPCASDVARMLDVPILYVNGMDPDAAVRAMRLAVDFRARFGRDVVVELRCLRRQGHNELDEPAFTQPRLYAKIDETPYVQARYAERLDEAGLVDDDEIAAWQADVTAELDRAHDQAKRSNEAPEPRAYEGIWSDYDGGPERRVADVDTGVPAETLTQLLETLSRVPEGFQRHPKLERAHDRRREMIDGERPLDWSAGEALAFATLAVDGVPVRLTGQDSARGTFGHRHAVLHDVETGATYEPFNHLSDGQAPVCIANSPLSELAVMGFEYGYSLDRPDALVCWEAQFGDFANMAQAVIDQFVASAEDKWRRLSGLTLLLPHGFEGKGPEHSSARLSRFLDLAAEDNMQIVQPTSPAQLFHVLRRQVLRPWRKPLVVLTPKSLLRDPEVVSPLDELADGRFRKVLPDPDASDIEPARLILCTGKVFFDLRRRRDELGRDDVQILRLEQLYPLSDDELAGALAHAADGTPVTWVQEEPENGGAWRWLRYRFGRRLLGRLPLSGVYREASASPATGAKSAHEREQERLLDRAFGQGGRDRGTDREQES